MMNLDNQGVILSSDDVQRVSDYFVGRVQRDEILAGADALFRTYTDRGVLGAFPNYGGAAGAFVMSILSGIASETPGSSMLVYTMALIIDKHRIPSDYVPPMALVREAIALHIHFNTIVSRLVNLRAIPTLPEFRESYRFNIDAVLRREAKLMVDDGRSVEDAYRIADDHVDWLLDSFRSLMNYRMDDPSVSDMMFEWLDEKRRDEQIETWRKDERTD